MSSKKARIATIAAAGALMVGAGATGAVGADMISGKDIKDRTVRGGDLASTAMGWRHHNEWSKKQMADYVEQNADIKDGVDGKDGVVGNIAHSSHEVTIPANQTVIAQVTCAPSDFADGEPVADMDYTAVGGGYTARGLEVTESRNMVSLDTDPTSVEDDDYAYNGKGWIVRAHNPSTSDKNLRTWVICIHAPNDDPSN